ncbi:serine hydrolase domain-containing protein, partial [Escherichia coli]|uniref:serine hydrolase domain-containing protein n=7 Tax=Pseudomonadota TaxID=1224 RepID=UPI0015B9FBCB
SKAYTATLVLKAIDEGRFGLDTRIADLVPGFGALGKQRATLRQLLAHTAGLPFGLVPPPLGLDKVGNLAVKAAAISALPAAYKPGTRCLYTSG